MRVVRVQQLGVGLESGGGWEVGAWSDRARFRVFIVSLFMILMGPKDRTQTEDSDVDTESELIPVAPRSPAWARPLGSPPDCLVALNLLLSPHFQGF